MFYRFTSSLVLNIYPGILERAFAKKVPVPPACGKMDMLEAMFRTYPFFQIL
jgi:hypothetical protein